MADNLSKKRLGRKISSTGNISLEEAKTTHSRSPCRRRRGSCSREQASIRRESKSSKPLSSIGPSRTWHEAGDHSDNSKLQQSQRPKTPLKSRREMHNSK